MPDAVEQARRQRDVLRRILTGEASNLRPGRGYTALGFDVLAAVSDNGVIEREVPTPKVVKADQVPAKIRAIADQRRALLAEASDQTTASAAGPLTRAEFNRTVQFLCRSHCPSGRPPHPHHRRGATTRGVVVEPSNSRHESPPRRAARPKPRPAGSEPNVASAPTHHCPACRGTTLDMRWGTRPVGYYFHCLACTKNWRPSRDARTCPSCRRPNVPLRKSRDVMLLDCPTCGHAGVFPPETGETGCHDTQCPWLTLPNHPAVASRTNHYTMCSGTQSHQRRSTSGPTYGTPS